MWRGHSICDREGRTRLGVTIWGEDNTVWDNILAENTGGLLNRTPEQGDKLNLRIDDNMTSIFSENTNFIDYSSKLIETELCEAANACVLRTTMLFC